MQSILGICFCVVLATISVHAQGDEKKTVDEELLELTRKIRGLRSADSICSVKVDSLSERIHSLNLLSGQLKLENDSLTSLSQGYELKIERIDSEKDSLLKEMILNLQRLKKQKEEISKLAKLKNVAEEDMKPMFGDGVCVDKDGRRYKTTRILDEWWMAEDYAYQTSVSLSAPNSSSGHIYEIDGSFECPVGWRLPTMEDWEELFRLIISEQKRYNSSQQPYDTSWNVKIRYYYEFSNPNDLLSDFNFSWNDKWWQGQAYASRLVQDDQLGLKLTMGGVYENSKLVRIGQSVDYLTARDGQDVGYVHLDLNKRGIYLGKGNYSYSTGKGHVRCIKTAY